MTAWNAASIGLSLGKVLDVENCSTKGPRSSSSPSLKVRAITSAPVTTVLASPMLDFSSALICAPSFAAVSLVLPQQATTTSTNRPTQLAEHVLHDSSSPRAVLLPHVAPYNPYLHILGHEAATSPAASTFSSVKPASPTERGKGVLIASDISSATLDNTPLARLMFFGLSPPLLTPSVGPPVHPSLPSSQSLNPSSPSSLTQPNIILPPPLFQLASQISPSSPSHHIQPSFNLPFFHPSGSSPRKTTPSGSRYHPYLTKTPHWSPPWPCSSTLPPPPPPPPSPARSSHPIGRKRHTASGDLDLQDRMYMAAYSLSSLKHVVVSPVALTTAFSSQPLPSAHSIPVEMVVPPDSPFATKIVYKAARKACSVTQLVLVDAQDIAVTWSDSAPTLEAVGSTMPPPVP
ncbi:uncharacterized protein LOC133867120 [Alnus glutinosa]|uniref:uncharacterized protein LOC133867120 n=1 Tax=Alnus glutinosa TaxID=3517 RepID=UPI002D784B6F|nr:uncharacterized protein LOC133867120 [Alnus glutinosa]